MISNRLRWSRIVETWAIITKSVPISGISRAAASAAKKPMDKEAASGSGLAVVSEVLLCEKCGKTLEGEGISFYDGARWQSVHSACVPEKGPDL